MIKEKKGGFKFIFGMDLKKVLFLAAQTLSVFVAIICLNFFGNFLKNTFDLKIDLVPEKVNSLSDRAKSYFKNYDKNKKIKLMLFEPYYEYANANLRLNTFGEFCQAVAASNSNFKFEIVSPNKKEVADFLNKVEVIEYMNPDKGEREKGVCLVVDETDSAHPLGIYLTDSMFSQEYVESFDDHLKKEEARRKAQANPGKVIGDEIGKVNRNVFAYERLFVGAFEKLSSKKQIRVAAVTGHNEHDFSMNEGIFNSVGAKIEKVNLEKGELSPEKQLLLVAAPKKDFSKEEIDKLNAFLNAGGKLVYFASAVQQSLENLDQFLKSHGIEFSEGVVLNFDSGRRPGAVMNIDLKKQNNAYTDKMEERKYPLILNACRPMVLNGSAVQDGWKLFEVCRTPANCVAATKESVKNMAELQKNAKAEYVMVGGAQKELGQGKVAKIVAVATENLLNGALMGDLRSEMSLCLTSNANFIYSLLKGTSGQNVIEYMPMKFVYNSSPVSQGNGMDGKPLTEEQRRVKAKVMLITMLMLPAVFMLIAVVMVVLRRRRK